MSPLSNAFVKLEARDRAEAFYPLHAYVCGKCLLVQLDQFETPENIFGDYVYFSSFSDSWLAHCRAYAQRMRERLGLGSNHRVVEVASNDGYLLQFFKALGVPVLGIEPARNVAAVARERGIETVCEFFGSALAHRLTAQGLRADLLVGNNVLAHVPELNDFVAGLAHMLAPRGVLTLEFPHLLQLIAETQFDTIYHEHFSYFSLGTAIGVLERHGLRVFDVEELPTHGGSIRVHACLEAADRPVEANVERMLKNERLAGLGELEAYRSFGAKVTAAKRSLLRFLIDAKDGGRRVVGYGAAAKGNTLLNYCGVRSDFLDFVADRSPHKQGLLLPGVGIPVVAPEEIFRTRPDYVLILPWNLKDEVMRQLAGISEWGGRFVVPIPEARTV